MKYSKLHYIIIIFIFLLSLRFFSYRYVDSTLMGRLTQLTSILMFLYAAFSYSKLNLYAKDYKSYRYVFFFYLFPLITSVACYLYHGQSYLQSIIALLPNWFLSIYFIAILFKIPPKRIINLLIICSLIRTGLTFIEQFTYPNVPFAFRMDAYDEFNHLREVEVRNGFYRYLISDAYFLPLFSAIYSIVKFTTKKSIKYLIIFIISCLGVYIDQTRQIIISLALCLCMLPFVGARKGRGKFIFILLILVAIVVSNFDVLFGEAVSNTQDQANDSNIRFISTTYFLDNTGDIISSLFGNGIPYPKSSYGAEIGRLQDLGIFTVDVGVFGAIYILGYIFVAVFASYYLFVVIRNWRLIDAYLRVYLISILINIPMIFPLYNSTLPCWECYIGLLFYLVDKSIQKNVPQNAANQ